MADSHNDGPPRKRPNRRKTPTAKVREHATNNEQSGSNNTGSADEILTLNAPGTANTKSMTDLHRC